MKKHVYLLMFTILGLMISCGSDDIIEGNTELEGAVFTAETEMPGDTRTSLSHERNILWSAGDHIAIFDKNTSSKEYELASGEGTCNGRFKEFSSTGTTGTALSNIVAVYPYTKECMVKEMSSTFMIEGLSIPSEQTYKENSFYQGSMPMVSVSQTSNLKFKNLGGLLKLNIKAQNTGEVINRITLQSRSENKEVISGNFSVNVGYDGQNPFAEMDKEESGVITLNCPSIKLSETETTTFYIVVPAIKFPNGFVITIYDGNSKGMTLRSKACSIERNQILTMPTITYQGSDISYNVVTPGTLSSMIGEKNKYSMTSMTVSGILNGTDIKFIREMAGRDVNGKPTAGKLVNLNIENASIVSGGEAYFIFNNQSYNTIDNIIGDYMFYETNLTEIKYPKTCYQIGMHAFEKHNLTNIIIPQNITSIKENAFAEGCKNMRIIRIPNTVTDIGESAFSFACVDTIELRCNTNDVSLMGSAFLRCNTKTLVIGNEVKHLGNYSFWKCDIQKIIYETKPQVEYIGDGCFSFNPLIEVMPIPSSANSIGYRAFGYCENLRSYEYVEGTGSSSTHRYNWTDGFMLIDFGVIGRNTIIDCPTNSCCTNVDDENGAQVVAIGKGAFWGHKNIESVWTDRIKYIEDESFENCEKLRNVYAFDIYQMGNYVFSNCKVLENVTINGSLTSIGNNTFRGCSNLKTVELGSNINIIEQYVFNECNSLQSITLNSFTPPTLDPTAFDENFNFSQITVYVPNGSEYKYRNSDWGKFNIQIKY